MDDKLMQHFDGIMKRECPCCKMEWFYDEENMRQYKNEVNGSLLLMLGFVRSLCAKQNDIHLYIRVHVYKRWCIYRIVVEHMYQQKFVDRLLKQCFGKTETVLYDISQDMQSTLIKVSYPIGD